jgi:hypothetical protein
MQSEQPWCIGVAGMWPERAICNAPRKGFTECAFPSDTFPQARAPTALRHSTFHITYFPPPEAKNANRHSSERPL